MYHDKPSKWQRRSWPDRLEDARRNIYWEHWGMIAVVVFSYAVAVDAVLSMKR